ncbi:hypothetical protein Mal64_04670 [Pseudobythopirellula maris]|uniref:Uncharacterized protein n=2 Tax=Pseudobythopirellula maris TaxID=2527991 RepID=A0A5C5ZRF6_9BACT|nr:hypothetical protein Mal64_04670 [Pseudobythopirellula maris]
MFLGDQHDLPEPDAEMATDLLSRAPSAGSWDRPPYPDETADAFFARLIDEGRLGDAVLLAAVSLGPRRAVWWGSLCVWDHIKRLKLKVEGLESAAVDAAVEWVLCPDDEKRLEAKAIADKAGGEKPWGALAMAPFWAGGSIAPADCPAVSPPAGLAEKIVANAVLKAAADPDPPTRQGRLMQSLRLAAEVQTGMTSFAAAAGGEPQ